MRHIIFEDASSFTVALLMKSSAFNKMELISNYVKPLKTMGVATNDIIAFTLEYDAKKVSVAYAKMYLEDLMPELKASGVKYLYCTDANYFKILTKEVKAEPHMGYVMPCKLPGYEHMKVVLGINYQQLIYNPELSHKVIHTLQALAGDIKGAYQAPGSGIIHKAIYPKGEVEIRSVLEALLEYPALTCDIEAFSLSFFEAGIASISFAIDEHNGVAFLCDYKPNEVQIPLVENRTDFGRYVPNPVVRSHLKWFFENYKGKLIYHNAGYDVKVMIYTLWMKSLLDTEGLLTGLELMSKNIDDTKIISYLATNSTAGNELSLKALAQEFSGNWAVDDIKDVRLIPPDKLLQYNLVDALSTWYVHKKNYPIMVRDIQENIYSTLMLPSQKLIFQIELTGMPMNAKKIEVLEQKLQAIKDKETIRMRSNPRIAYYEEWRTEQNYEKDYQDRKNKAKNPDKIQYKDRSTFPKHEFNSGSPNQLQTLLYEMMGLPKIDFTDTKQPATGEETLKKLLNHTASQADKDMIEALIAVSQVDTILSTFLPAFKRAIDKDGSGIVWLHGNFNIGGTVSGRLSSSKPKQHWASQE
jgi:DNA polymerase-1